MTTQASLGIQEATIVWVSEDGYGFGAGSTKSIINNNTSEMTGLVMARMANSVDAGSGRGCEEGHPRRHLGR